MEQRVIVNSFHSQVGETLIRTLNEVDIEPDVVVCLDSHIDDHIGTEEAAKLMPKNIELAAHRASAHTWIRRSTGGLPILLKTQNREDEIEWITPMSLVIPQSMINTHIAYHQNILEGSSETEIAATPEFFQRKQDYLEYLKKFMGYSIIASPPQNLLKLVDFLRTDFAILDIDVDYMHEMQNECYTPVKKAKPGDLGWMEQVLRLIKKTKPKLITMSEARVSAIKNPSSNYSKFVSRLHGMGYKIEYDQIFDSDKEAEDAMDKYQEFFEKIQLPIMRNNAGAGFLEATRKYFSANNQL
jgi:hypothetical protein